MYIHCWSFRVSPPWTIVAKLPHGPYTKRKSKYTYWSTCIPYKSEGNPERYSMLLASDYLFMYTSRDCWRIPISPIVERRTTSRLQTYSDVSRETDSLITHSSILYNCRRLWQCQRPSWDFHLNSFKYEILALELSVLIGCFIWRQVVCYFDQVSFTDTRACLAW